MNPSVNLRVMGTAAPDGPGPEVDLAGIVEAAAGPLLESLGVPARIEVEDGGSLPGTTGAPPYLLEVDGEPARLDRSIDASERELSLRFRLEADLRRNAHLFLTPAVTEALRERWEDHSPRPPVADLAPDRLLRLARECVGAGCRLDRLAQTDPQGDERDPIEWRLLEGALEEAARLRFRAPDAAPPPDGPGSLAESLQDMVHAAWGVLLPTPTVSPSAPVGSEAREELGVEVLDLSYGLPLPPAGEASGAMLAAVRPWLPWFLTRETLGYALSRAEEGIPRLTGAVRERYGDVFLARTFRALLAEGFGVGDLRTLLAGLLEIREPTSLEEAEAIVFHAPAGTPPPRDTLAHGRVDPDAAADCVRRWARWKVASTYGEAGAIRARLLDPDLEEEFRRDGVRPGTALHRRFLDALQGSTVPILTNVDVRRRVWTSLAPERPDVPVLCFQELHPDSRITPVERISP